MSKAITLNSNWQSRSASFSTHASRKGVNLLGWDCILEESMDDEQKRAALGAHRQFLERQLEASKAVGDLRAIRRLGQEIAHTNQRINEIRPCRRARDLSNYIVDILKPRMTKSEWQRVVDEAYRLKAAAEKSC